MNLDTYIYVPTEQIHNIQNLHRFIHSSHYSSRMAVFASDDTSLADRDKELSGEFGAVLFGARRIRFIDSDAIGKGNGIPIEHRSDNVAFFSSVNVATNGVIRDSLMRALGLDFDEIEKKYINIRD